MKIMNKKALAEVLATKFDMTKKAAGEVVDVVFEEVAATLAEGGKVDISGFGKFEVKERPARQGINPATKEPMMIKASKSPAFKAAKALKEEVNK